MLYKIIITYRSYIILLISIMKNSTNLLLIISLIFNSFFLNAQHNRSNIDNYLQAEKENLSLTEFDISNWRMSSEHLSKDNDMAYAYIQQTHNDIDILNALCNFTIDKNGEVLHVSSTFVSNTQQKVNTTNFSIDEYSAMDIATRFKYLQFEDLIDTEMSPIYFSINSNELRLSHHVVLHVKGRHHVWSVIIDGVNGEVLHSFDQVVHCQFDHNGFGGEQYNHIHAHNERIDQTENSRRTGAYSVFAIPAESPIHGDQSLVTDPASANASPYGWHDNNGSEGAEYTITRGNNVFAYEDADDNDSPGYSPDGGASLNFDFPYTVGASPLTNQDAAITNLFYISNIVHDVYYNYGFDEAAGNFQSNNYGNGGSGDDEVQAEGLDGAGLNNANFFTPSDGQKPSMQMFLWSGASQYFYINSPSNIAGGYATAGANFGPEVPTSPLTGDLALYDDGVDPINDACEDPINAAELDGKIVVIDRNSCTFASKVLKAQNAGAIAAIIVNNVDGPPVTLGGNNNSINIPSLMVTMEDGNSIKEEITNGTVNGTIVDSSSSEIILDGDFDNGIIAHEYGHGISTRLVGGRLRTTCLYNDEQMGEGWSDWFALMLTMDMNVANPVYRPIGTFVRREDPNSGLGIRPAPYDTSFVTNDFTYGDIDEVSIPHGVGFIWSSILWDLTWALIDEYGYDPDIYNGTGGNNMAMKLVINGLKIISCNPGFVNGRNSILMADQINYGGANECLIWEVFARRGVGFEASQGSSFSVEDGIESFLLPPECNDIVTLDPNFTADVNFSCDGEIQFTNTSTGAHNSWDWDFGDGNSSTDENPLHTYEGSGTYTITLTISNGMDNEDEIKTDYVTISILEAPTAVSDAEGCVEETFTLTAISDNTLFWFDENGNLLDTGDPFVTPPLSINTTYQVADALINDNDTCISEKLPLTVFLSEANFEFSPNELTVSFTDISTNATSWDWKFGDGNSSTQQNPVHTYTDNGIYQVELSINNKLCTIIFEVNLTTVGISETFENGGIDILPNPANNSTLIKSGIDFPEKSIIQLVGIDGRILIEKRLELSDNTVELDLKNINSGIYSIVIALEDKQLIQRKLVVNKQ